MNDNQAAAPRPVGELLTITELVQLLAAGTGAVVEVDSIDNSTTFDDIGVDSLGLLGVITTIERGRGVALPEDSQQVERITEFLSIVNGKSRRVN